VAVLAIGAAPVQAQDAARGRRLFEATATVTGKQVGACAECHSDTAALREMIVNRGRDPRDPKKLALWLAAVFDGAQPNARDAKAQYRGVFSARDLADLAAYIASTVTAQPPLPLLPRASASG